MIVDIHTHANGHFYAIRKQAGMSEASVSDWINRILIPYHPYLKAETVDQYYSEFSPEKFITEMDEAGIDKAVIQCAEPSGLKDEYVYNTYIKRYPDRILAFSGVNPLNKLKRFDRKSLDRVDKAVKDYGFKGVGELLPAYMGYSPNDKRIYPLYEKITELKVPILIHAAATPVVTAVSHMEFARPCFLEQVADDFPDLNIIAAHMGYPWVEELLALMEKNVNIYADIAHLCIREFLLTWYLVMAKEYRVINRIMFGTDTSCRPPKHYIEFIKVGVNHIAKRAGWPTLSREEIDGLLGENSRKLLKL